MSFPGGAGTYGQVGLAKPAKLRKEPKAVSRHPLYGVCRDTPTGPAFLFRLDESKGNGKGYDQLIVDMNQNGDLSDDTVAQRVVLATDRRVVSPAQMLFGPIQAPADKALAGGRPVYFARVYIFNQELLASSRPDQGIMAGQLMLKAGWYLDATVTLDGLKQRVGVYDGDCNLKGVTASWSAPITRPAPGARCSKAKRAPSAPSCILAPRLTKSRWPRTANPCAWSRIPRHWRK